MKGKFLFDYDGENDSLYIYKKGVKVKGSLDLGNIILDISTDEKVVGLEILDASKVMKNLAVKSPQSFLENIKEASIRAEYRPGVITVYYLIHSEMKEPVTSSILVPVNRAKM